MKKGTILAKITSVVLTVAMTVGLSACGTKMQKGDSADPSLAKQYVYSAQELDFDMDADDISMRGMQRLDDRIYMLMELYDYESTKDYNTVMLYSMNSDGSDIKGTSLQFPGQEQETASGSDENTSEPEDDTADTQDDVAGEDTEGQEDVIDDSYGYDDSNIYEYTSYGNYCLTKDGYIYGTKNYNYSDYSDPENYINQVSYSLCCWDMEGQFLWEKPIEHLHADEDTYYYISNMALLEDGTLAILVGGDSYQKIEADTEGNMSALKALPALAECTENLNSMMVKDDGEFLMTYYDDSWQNMYMRTYDIQTDTLGEETKLPDFFSYSGYNAMTTGVNTDIVYATSSGIYGLNIGDEQPTQIMSFINSDLNTTYVNNLLMLDEEHFIGFYMENDSYDSYGSATKGAIFTKRNPEDIPDKSVLVLAANYVNSDIRQRVIDFNKSSEQYRIVVKEYESYATSEDYMAGYTQLNNDIISGNMPDILVYDDNIATDSYISKGLLADVGELIAQDEELSKVEYLANVFDAYRINGKLYQVIPSFYARSVIGKKSLLGSKDSWTFAELQELMKTMPEGAREFGEMTRSSFLWTMMQYCGNNYVDASTGKCNFDSPDFIAMLEYANSLPEEINNDYDDPNYWENYWKESQSQYRENRTLLMECYIGSIKDMNYSINGSFGEDVAFIGFPTESGSGSVLAANNNAFMLSAKSANLDGAWEFVRYYLTEDYQKTINWGMPTIKSVFMEKAAEAKEKPYYMDGDKKVEYDEYYEINGESVPLEPMTQEQIDTLVEFVQTIDKVMYYNQNIQNILEEETASYFAGQKNVNEVVQIIQSRAQIYVDENR